MRLLQNADGIIQPAFREGENVAASAVGFTPTAQRLAAWRNTE